MTKSQKREEGEGVFAEAWAIQYWLRSLVGSVFSPPHASLFFFRFDYCSAFSDFYLSTLKASHRLLYIGSLDSHTLEIIAISQLPRLGGLRLSITIYSSWDLKLVERWNSFNLYSFLFLLLFIQWVDSYLNTAIYYIHIYAHSAQL